MSRGVRDDIEKLRAREVERIRDQHWACSVCDSGGHPFTKIHAAEEASRHSLETGHFTIWGTIRERTSI